MPRHDLPPFAGHGHRVPRCSRSRLCAEAPTTDEHLKSDFLAEAATAPEAHPELVPLGEAATVPRLTWSFAASSSARRRRATACSCHCCSQASGPGNAPSAEGDMGEAKTAPGVSARSLVPRATRPCVQRPSRRSIATGAQCTEMKGCSAARELRTCGLRAAGRPSCANAAPDMLPPQ
jgi:hypothetical protein